jgi:hypothetical protein
MGSAIHIFPSLTQKKKKKIHLWYITIRQASGFDTETKFQLWVKRKPINDHVQRKEKENSQRVWGLHK